MNWPLATDVFIATMLLACLIYEAIVVVGSDDADSISWQIWQGVKKRPFIAFLMGYLCGHLTWQMQ